MFTFTFASVSHSLSLDEDIGKFETVKMEQVLQSYEVMKTDGWELSSVTFETTKEFSPYAIARFTKEQCEMVCFSKTISDFTVPTTLVDKVKRIAIHRTRVKQLLNPKSRRTKYEQIVAKAIHYYKS